MSKKTLALLRLIRLPNVFTAVSNVWAGFVLASEGHFVCARLLLVSAASAGLYSGGVALNDYFDREHDRRERPQRPLPSGALSSGTALVAGALLLLAGALCGFLLSPLAGSIAAGIAAAALLYDAVLKRWFLPALLAMGTCRGLNWSLGLAAGEKARGELLLLPAVVFLYTVLVSAVARYEAKAPLLKGVVKFCLSAIPLVDGAIVLLFGYYYQAAAVALLVIPVIILGRVFEMT